jgi:hypothetical protein
MLSRGETIGKESIRLADDKFRLTIKKERNNALIIENYSVASQFAKFNSKRLKFSKKVLYLKWLSQLAAFFLHSKKADKKSSVTKPLF